MYNVYLSVEGSKNLIEIFHIFSNIHIMSLLKAEAKKCYNEIKTKLKIITIC